MDISVIIPFHNSEHILSASIESIINQSFENWEMILIDRNSDDDSGRIARGYESDDDRIVYLKEKATGLVATLNKGVQTSSGNYVSIIEPGDIALPQKLEKQYRYLEENKDYDVVASCAEYVNDEGLQFGNFEYIKWTNGIRAHEEITGSSFIDCPVIHSTIMYRKGTIKNELYRLGDFPEDYEILLRLLNKNIQMHKLSEHLLEWKDSPERLEKKNDLLAGPAFKELKAYYLYEWLKKNNPYHPKIIVWGAGKLSRHRFSLLRDLGVQPKFFIDFHANPEYNVVEYTQTPPAGNNFIVAYSSNPEIRGRIRDFLTGIGYLEGKNYIFCS